MSTDLIGVTVTGNNGGDYIKFHSSSDEYDNIVHLEVGHCCVVTVNTKIPVEILTSLLSTAINGSKLVDPSVLEWPAKYNEELLTQMKAG